MARHCPKCNNVMDLGVLGESVVGKWNQVAPESISSDMNLHGYVIPSGSTGEALSAYRCKNCGFVELLVQQ
jgi:hypothetical protein